MNVRFLFRPQESIISQQKYRWLYEVSGIGIGYYSPEGTVLSYNRLAAKHMNGVPGDFIGKSIHDLFPKAEADIYQERIRRAAETEEHVVYEDAVRLPTGTMHFLSTFTRISDSSGKLPGIQIISQDITERKKTEKLLRDSEERMKFALEGSGLGEWDWNLKTDRIKRNERWAQMLGYSLSEIEDNLQQGVELQHPDDREAAWRAIQDHLAGRTESYILHYRMRSKDGSYRWIRDCGKIMERDEQGKAIRLCGTHADIDEQKRSEELVSKSKDLMTSILESSPDVIVFALDREYRYLAFNSRHKSVIKQIWGKDIALGMCILDILGDHPDGAKARQNFDRALMGESFAVVEEYGDEALSRQSWLDYWSPIKTRDGDVVGLTCFVLNNTEQRLAEARIQALLAEKEIILKEVHHRIKNNMGTISSLLSLQAGSILDPSSAAVLRDAGDRIQSMSLLYDQLSRSEGFTELPVKDYLPALVDAVIGNFPNSPLVKVEKTMDDFILDAQRLQPIGIIINELLTNAMKYAFKGRDHGMIAVTATNRGGHVAITVQDDGVGIPGPAILDSSTGFGLQLVQALSQQLRGTLRIEQGKGMEVVLEFEA